MPAESIRLTLKNWRGAGIPSGMWKKVLNATTAKKKPGQGDRKLL
jgi:hypothetical protein